MTHAEKGPEHCQSCRLVFKALQDLAAETARRRTVPMICERSGLERPTVYKHLAHLRAHHLIEDDLRTPVAEATIDPAPEVVPSMTPLRYITSVQFADAGCALAGKIYAASADPDTWSGILGYKALATAAGRSARWAGEHSRHLVRDGLLFITYRTVAGAGGRPRRLPSEFKLFRMQLAALPRDAADASSPEDVTTFQEQARTLVSALDWMPKTKRSHVARSTQLVAALLHRGWPTDELHYRLTHRPVDDRVMDPYRLLAHRLPSLDSAYVPVPRPVGVAGTEGQPRPRCRVCGIVWARRDVAPGALCHQCQADEQPQPSTIAPAGRAVPASVRPTAAVAPWDVEETGTG